MAATDEPLVVTVEDAARKLGVSRTTIYNEIAAGRIRSLKIGKARRIPVAELHRIISAAGATEAA